MGKRGLPQAYIYDTIPQRGFVFLSGKEIRLQSTDLRLPLENLRLNWLLDFFHLMFPVEVFQNPQKYLHSFLQNSLLHSFW